MSKCVRCDEDLTPQEEMISYLCERCLWEDEDKQDKEYDEYYHNEMQRIHDEETSDD